MKNIELIIGGTMATKKETFMQGVVTVMFSQILIKVLGLIYTLYLTNREGFGDAGNAISKLVSERLAIRRQ